MAFLTGTVVLEGREELSGVFGGRTAQVALAVVLLVLGFVFSTLSLGVTRSGRPFPWLLVMLAGGFLLAPLALLLVMRATHRLTLSPSGIAIEDLHSGRIRQEPWQKHTTLTAAVVGDRITQFLGDRDPVADITVDSGENERLLAFAARMPAGQARALSRQVALWSAAAPPPGDALAPYRACSQCLLPGCNCATGVRDLLIVPAFGLGYNPAWNAYAAFGPVVMNLFRAKSGHDFIFFVFCILLVIAVPTLRRRDRGVPARQLRLGPDGYQICNPAKSLKLKAWRSQGFHLKRFHFQKPQVGFTGANTHLATQTPTIEIPNPALVQLRSQIQRWSYGLDRKIYGFPIE